VWRDGPGSQLLHQQAHVLPAPGAVRVASGAAGCVVARRGAFRGASLARDDASSCTKRCRPSAAGGASRRNVGAFRAARRDDIDSYLLLLGPSVVRRRWVAVSSDPGPRCRRTLRRGGPRSARRDWGDLAGGRYGDVGRGALVALEMGADATPRYLPSPVLLVPTRGRTRRRGRRGASWAVARRSAVSAGARDAGGGPQY
jgi:hypothetical protein